MGGNAEVTPRAKQTGFSEEKKPALSVQRGGCLVFLVEVGFMLIVFSSVLRAWTALWSAPYLQSAEVDAPYLALSGGVWAVVALFAIFSLISSWKYARLAGMAAALFLAITYWADRLLLGKPYGVENNAPFAVFLTLFALALAWLILRPEQDFRPRR